MLLKKKPEPMVGKSNTINSLTPENYESKEGK